jgi:predicted lipid-binding transport protein (Tim44 family)
LKKILSVMALVFSLGLGSMAIDAEAAKRIGSGKSVGTQRQATADKAPGTPAQSAAAAPAAGAAGAAAAAPSRSWMGPVAGLAAGLGIAALASSLGFGGELASMVMMGLLAVAVMAAIGFFLRKRAAAQQGGAASGGMHPALATLGSRPQGGNMPPAYRVDMPQGNQTNRTVLPASGGAAGGSAIGSAIGSAVGSSIGSGVSADSAVRTPWPADFDVAGFERNAKVNFIRLQAANDAGNLEDISQFTTPQMFAELKMDLSERGTSPQKTDVIQLQAQVVDVEEGAVQYVVSVRFTGMLNISTEEANESFDETWHFEKPRSGNGGWVLSGIQQTS